MRNRFAVVFGVGLLVLSVMGCQRDIEKDKMDGIATWMAAACACAQKPGASTASCKAANPEPPEAEQMGTDGKPQYKLDSYQQYSQMRIRGEDCLRKIGH